jgi:TrpR family trp operon transcriptional repressor
MNNKQINDLITVLLKIKDRKEMLDFLKGIFTPKELEEIPTRLTIVRMLKKGIAQEKIAKELKVGIGTVTRGSNELRRGRFKNIK